MNLFSRKKLPCPVLSDSEIDMKFYNAWWDMVHNIKFGHWVNPMDLVIRMKRKELDATIWAADRLDKTLFKYIDVYNYWIDSKMEGDTQYIRIVKRSPLKHPNK